MNLPTITIAMRSYDRTAPLLEGAVTHPAFNFNVIELPGGSRVMGFGERFLDDGEFDAIEICFMPFLSAVDRGFPIIGVPVFPRRQFTQSGWWKNLHAGIETPADFAGKRVGSHTYQTVYSVIARGELEHFYGVPWKSMTWVIPQDADAPIAPAVVPADVRLEVAASLDQMAKELIEGTLHTLFIPFPRGRFSEASASVGRLFSDVRAEEERFLKEQGYAPISHTVAVKRELVARYPELPAAIYHIFNEAHRIARRRWEDPPWSLLFWGSREMERQSGLSDHDPWTNGLEVNRKALEHILLYSFEQGVTRRLLTVDELFLPLNDNGA